MAATENGSGPNSRQGNRCVGLLDLDQSCSKAGCSLRFALDLCNVLLLMTHYVSSNQQAGHVDRHLRSRALGLLRRVQISTNKKPLNFYLTLSRRIMHEHGEVELSALGMGR